MSREATTFNIEIIFFQRKTLISINILTLTTSQNWKKVFKCIYYHDYPPIFTLDLPNMHEYITLLLHSIFNHRKDIVYRRSSSILISVVRISYCKITLYEFPFNIQRRLGLGVAYVAILVEVAGSTLGKKKILRFFYL